MLTIMIQVRNLILSGSWILFSLLVSLTLFEVAFQFLPVSDTLKTLPVNRENHVLRFTPSRSVSFQMGFNFSKITKKKVNNIGYLDNNDLTEGDFGKSAVIIGDSYVEAIQVSNKDTISGQLSSRIKDKKIFSIGASGAPLSQYLVFAQYAETAIKPKEFIFVIVGNDFDESLFRYKKSPGFHYYNDDFFLERVDYEPGLIRKIVRESAFVRYLMFDLKIKHQFKRIRKNFIKLETSKKFASSKKEEDLQKMKLSKKVVLKFFEDLKNIVGDTPVLFLIDGDRGQIYDGNKSRSNDYQSILFNFFKSNCCKYLNFKLIDLHPVFTKHFNENEQPFNFELDYHWNELGHRVAADAIIVNGFLTR